MIGLPIPLTPWKSEGGVAYQFAIGLKFTGDTEFREVPLKGCSRVIVFTQDLIRA